MRAATLYLLVLVPAITAEAQLADVLPGARVRVESRAFSQRIEGTVMTHSGDSIIVANSGAVRTAIPLTSIYRLHASQGKSHAVGAIKGAKIGAIIGGGFAVLIMVSGEPSPNGTYGDAVAATAAFAVSGAFWGIVIGAIVGAEDWRTVHSQPLRVGAAVAPSGLPAVGLSLRF